MDGIIVINKEEGYTSRDIVNIVSKQLHTKKVGHTGTLDPMAKGVLVLGVNQGTKIIEYLMADKKEYIASVQCGILTDTLDTTGQILKQEEEFVLKKEEVEKTLRSFLGKSRQEVPKYSAIHVNGKRLYEYARDNIEVSLPKKEIEITKIQLLECSTSTFSFLVEVSSGTYIRSLIRDIGKKLNILCSMSALTRTKEGIFFIEDAYTLKQIKEKEYTMLSLKESLKNYRQIEVEEALYKKIYNGCKLEDKWNVVKQCIFIYKDQVVGIYEKKGDILKAKKIFHKEKAE